MRIAICSDEPHALHEWIVEQIEIRGHHVVRFGSFKTGQETSWALSARAAALEVAQKNCDEGIFLCWTGTGISIAANKIYGIRAALCSDAETTRGARIWNHANVLAMSNRLLTKDSAAEILSAWYDTPWDQKGQQGVLELAAVDEEFRKHS